MTEAKSKSIILLLQESGLILLAMSLPLANLFMSISTFWLVGVWLLWIIWDLAYGRSPWTRIASVAHQPSALAIIGLFVLFVLGLAWTAEVGMGIKDVLIKLPLFVIPFTVSAFEPTSEKALRRIFKALLLGLLIATSICFSVHWGVYNSVAVPLGFKARYPVDVRDISILISHIRFSLLLVFGIAVSFYMVRRKQLSGWLAAASSLFFLSFLWTVESVTGFGLLVVLAVGYFLRWAWRSSTQRVKVLALTGSVLLAAGSIAMVAQWYKHYFAAEKVDWNKLETTTAQGNSYQHWTENKQLENTHYIWLYICEKELEAAWPMRSKMPLHDSANPEKSMHPVLIRYLTSKGLRKDAQGVMALSDKDIELIERGIPSITWVEKSGIRLRFDRLFFEWDAYKNSLDPNGHSVRQRFLFWDAALRIFMCHPVFGVGTGDVRSSFQHMYTELNSPLSPKNRLYAHNQYLATAVALGGVGLLFFLFCWWVLVRQKKNRDNSLFLVLMVIVLLSFFTEDTLESQSGVTLVAYLFTLLTVLHVAPADKQPLQEDR
jgi:hypothetical protein